MRAASWSAKRLDLICANRVGVGRRRLRERRQRLLVTRPDGERALGPASKTMLAGELLDRPDRLERAR
jgi:phosphopantothenoylcysteine synthetase/decarboxylase